jgi:hypothetical protein
LLSEFGVTSVLDLLDDAITDNDLRGPIMAMPQLDVNRFRLAGSRASDVLRRDFGATARGDGSRPFDLRAALGLWRFVGRSVDLALGATVTVTVPEAKPSDSLAGPPSLLHVRSLTPPADLNAASRLSAEAPPAGHRRVQSASPRVPEAAADPVRPPLNLGTASAGMPRAASDPEPSAQASRNARKPPLSQPHRRNTSSGTISSNASGGTVGDRGQLRTSSVSSAGSAAGRRRGRLKGSQRGGSERGSRRSASPGNNGFENL